MKVKALALVLALAFIVSAFGVGAQPAAARVDTLTGASLTCNDFGVSGTFSSGNGQLKKVGVWVFDTVAGKTVAFAFIAGPALSGTYSGSVHFDVPNGTLLYLDISTYPADADGPEDFDPEQYFFGFINCAVPPFAGPTVPAGAELKTITCDVAVFDEPGGKPVGSNRIKGGQTWYVIPGVKADSTGRNWVQVYVSGFGLPWIPASCVPGADVAKTNTGVKTTTATTASVASLPPVGIGRVPTGSPLGSGEGGRFRG